MEKFSDFISEQKNEQPYDLLVMSHDGIDDVNETGPLIKNTGKKMGLNVFLAEMMGAYTEDVSGGKLLYSFKVDDKGVAHLPSSKEQLDYEKPFKINPETLFNAILSNEQDLNPTKNYNDSQLTNK